MLYCLDQVLAKAHHQDHAKSGFEGRPSTDTLTAAYNAHGDLLCYGGLEGVVHGVTATAHPYKQSFTLSAAMADGKALSSAVSSLQFHPSTGVSARGLLLATCSDGNLSLWHLGSQKALATADEMAYHADKMELTDVKNQIETSAFNVSGSRFATGGKDGVIRLYNHQTLAVEETLVRGRVPEIARAHKLKVSSLKFVDDNTLVSGGWDDAVQIWDVRAGHAVRTIAGPQLGGDALDVHPDGKTLVTGSSRTKDQLQLWDMSTGEAITTVRWPVEPRSRDVKPEEFIPTTCLAAKFSPDGKYVAAGGDHDFRIFNTSDLVDARYSSAVCGEFQSGGGSPDGAVYGVAWAPSGQHVAVCGSKTVVMSTSKGLSE